MDQPAKTHDAKTNVNLEVNGDKVSKMGMNGRKTESDEVGDTEKNMFKQMNIEKHVSCFTYEEALELTGHGAYNIGLLLVCFLIIIAMGIDIFGIGIIVTAATCDLGLTLSNIGVLSSMPFAGIIVMSYPWGYLSDTRGRKLVLMWSMAGSFVCATLSSFSPNWQVLAALRFLGSALSSAAESVTYALLGECCRAKLRARYMLLITSALMLTPTLYYVSAYFIMKMDFSIPFMGILLRPWRLLTLLMALPLGLSAVMLYFFCESPKFLANVGRNKEAVRMLRKIYQVNGKKVEDYPVKEILLEEETKDVTGEFSVRSLWEQIAPLFKPPLLSRTLLLYCLTFVVYAANNSFAIILPTIFNMFFDSLEVSDAEKSTSFCKLFTRDGGSNSTAADDLAEKGSDCKSTINDYTILAGCAHGLSFFVINTVLSHFAARRKVLTVAILTVAGTSALVVDNTGEPISGLVMFYLFLTTAMVFGVISSYFVDLYPTSYRGMVACLGMVVARLSAFAGTNVVSSSMAHHCSATLYGVATLVFSGVIASLFLPRDSSKLIL